MADVKTITLAGVSYDIPALPLKVVRKVVPLAARVSRLGFDPMGITESDIDALIQIAHSGIEFGRPSFKIQELENAVIPLEELQAAVQVVLEQAGMKAAPEGKPQAV